MCSDTGSANELGLAMRSGSLINEVIAKLSRDSVDVSCNPLFTNDN